MSEMHVYRFGPDMTDGKAAMKNLLGGKGANLAEMSSLNIPVPPGFTITTSVCNSFLEKKTLNKTKSRLFYYRHLIYNSTKNFMWDLSKISMKIITCSK